MLSKEERDAIRKADDLTLNELDLLDTCDELEQILRDIQWRGDIGHCITDISICPACGSGQNIYDQHGYGCPIGRVLTAKPTE